MYQTKCHIRTRTQLAIVIAKLTFKHVEHQLRRIAYVDDHWKPSEIQKDQESEPDLRLILE